MATFVCKTVRRGSGDSIKSYLSLSEISASEDEEVVEIPELYEGKPLTHIAYEEDLMPAHLHFHDWNHPSDGGDWLPDTYSLSYTSLTLPRSIKRIVLSRSVEDISCAAFKSNPDIAFSVHPDNPRYMAVDGKLHYKKTGTPVPV